MLHARTQSSTTKPQQTAPEPKLHRPSMDYVGFLPLPDHRTEVEDLLRGLEGEVPRGSVLKGYAVAMRGDAIEFVLELDVDYDVFSSKRIGTDLVRLARHACNKVRRDYAEQRLE